MRHFWFMLLVLVAATPAHAQPLVESIPADAVVYVGWAGSDSLGDGYEGSHLQGVAQASNVKALVERVVPALTDIAAMEDPNAAEALDLIRAISGAAFHYPTAFYLGPIGVEGEQPDIRFAIICDAGDDAPALADRLRAVVQEMGRTPMPIRVSHWAGRLALEVGEVSPRQQTRLGGPLRIAPLPSMKDHKSFQAAMAPVNGDAAMAVYVDVEAILATVDQVAAKEAARFADRFPNRRNEAAQWPKLRDALGLAGIKRLAMTSGFDGKMWQDRLFIDAPAPRRGLAMLLDSKPLTDDLFKAIPHDAAIAAVGQLDLGALLDELRRVMTALDPNARQQLEDGLVQIEQQTGVNVENGLLKALGTEWAVYTSDTIAGQSVMGMIIMNRPRDVEALQNTINHMVGMTNQIVAAQTQDSPLEFQLRQMDIDGVTVQYAPLLFVTPCWAIRDGTMYMALYPQALASALAYDGQSSILDNPRFAAMRKQFNVTPGAMQWIDLEQTAPDSYQSLLMLSSLIEGGASVAGAPTPLILPPLHQLMPHITPATSASWSDDAGFHLRNTTPFPGSSLLAMQGNNALAQQAMMVGTLLPALGKARQSAKRTGTMANARGLAISTIGYAQVHEDQLPPSLTDAEFLEHSASELLKHPSDQSPMPVKVDEAWLRERGAFIYVAEPGKKLSDIANPSHYVLLCEHPRWSDGQHINTAFADGSVRQISVHELNRYLTQQVGKNYHELLTPNAAASETAPPPAP